MSQMTSEYYAPRYRGQEGDWPQHYPAERAYPARQGGPDVFRVGMAAVGLGALAWYYFGPDVVRYLKIREM